jgi:cell wall-associated NlpC family hydrolase
MASHRRSSAPVRSVVAWTATTTAMATVGVVLTPAVSHAATTAEVQAQVAALDKQAEQATNDYDQAMEQLTGLQRQVDDIQGEAAAVQKSMNALMSTLGPQAAAQYRSGSVDPTLTLMLSQNPDQYLSRALEMSQFAQNEALELKSLKLQQAQMATLKKQAADRLSQLQQTQAQAAAKKSQIEGKYKQAQALLSQLTFAQQQTVAQSLATSGVTAAQIAGLPQVSGRAGVAIKFAESKIGMWYQWGGTGNPSYDCSGLTQAAYAAAGISLGRTTYDQVTDGYAVAPSLADLQPGDLIFYDDNGHMGIYVGNGVIVHAPTTGHKIEYAPWNLLPINAVRRVI